MTNKPIRFRFADHGLGDVVHAATAMRLYVQRGYDVVIQVEPNKRWVWEAAGIPIYDGPDELPTHPYHYPLMRDFWDLSRPDHTYSKIAHFFEIKELPKLTAKDVAWQWVCNERIDARPSISLDIMEQARRFLDGLPKPIVLLHTKGTNWQEKKSIPDAAAFQLIRDSIDTLPGSVVTLDWDGRSPTLGHERVRPIKPNWGHISCEQFAALCCLSDLLIGVDSGPFHLAAWTPIKTLFVGREIPPVRCSIPSPNATYLVPARDHEHWVTRGSEWTFAEFHGPEATPKDITLLAYDLLAAQPREVTVQDVTTETVPGRYLYARVGYDERGMEFLTNGKIGYGSAGCERAWRVEQSPGGPVLTIYGDHGGPTCHLRMDVDGVLRGRWLHHERMPIELTPDPEQVIEPAVTVRREDLEPVGRRNDINANTATVTDDDGTRPLWDVLSEVIGEEMGNYHPSDRLPDAPEEFYCYLPTLNCFDLAHKCIESILASTWLPKRIYVVDNSGGKFPGHPSRRVEVWTPPRNLGAGGTANVMFPAILPATLIALNDDIELAPDTLEAMVSCKAPVVVADGTSAFTVSLIRDEAWRKVGPFDPVFHPAYCEDADWEWRAKQIGITPVCPPSAGFRENGPSATRKRMSEDEQQELDRHYDRSKEYYIRKWGGVPRLEVFTRPFDGVPE